MSIREIGMNISSVAQASIATPAIGGSDRGSSVVSPQQAAQQRVLAKAAGTINASQVLGPNNELTFVIDQATHVAVARVVDQTTQEVVMQVPSEYVLQMAAAIEQQEQKQAAEAGPHLF